MNVRLIRSVDAPGRDGPTNGMWALQTALRRWIRSHGLKWLSIGAAPRKDDLAWVWHWRDRHLAAYLSRRGRPLVVGPNVVFADSRRPRIDRAESAILDSAVCRTMFCHSRWYADLIDRNRGPRNISDIVAWPYPIDPKPGGPLKPSSDLLIYVKSGPRVGKLAAGLARAFRRSEIVEYGRYRRRDLFEAARRSRACVYLSDDDHGPLALAEILLAGCPTAGVARGTPFVTDGITGRVVGELDAAELTEAIEACFRLDRGATAGHAAEQFDTERIVTSVLKSLAVVTNRGDHTTTQ